MAEHDWNMPHLGTLKAGEPEWHGCPTFCPYRLEHHGLPEGWKMTMDGQLYPECLLPKSRNAIREEHGLQPIKQKIYISGPMRGYDNLNAAAFNSVADTLRDTFTVFSPAAKINTGEHDNDTPYSVAIREDIQALLQADAIILLPGWEQSEGARFEAEIARSLNLDFYLATNNEPLGFEEELAWIYAKTDAAKISVEGIDQEARRLVYGDRAATYGHPRGDFAIIAKIWSGILETTVTEEQVALCMAGLKLARLAKSPHHRDSQVDTIGYMLCLARLQEDPAEIAAWNTRAEQRSRD